MTLIRIGSRASPLALTQAKAAANFIAKAHSSELQFEFKKTMTTGDINQKPFDQIRQDNLFVKEVEEMLLDGLIDVAIHSLKDIPVVENNLLEIAAVFEPESYHDTLISANNFAALQDLPQRATVGTSSSRRKAQLLNLRPDLSVVGLRGNIETRIRKLHSENLDAIILAEAGLRRLGMDIGTIISIDEMLPSAGQGVLAAQIRKDDDFARAIVSKATHGDTWRRIITERRVLQLIQAGCGDPVACLALVNHDIITVKCVILNKNGTIRYESQCTGSDPYTLAEHCADNLIGVKHIWKQS